MVFGQTDPAKEKDKDGCGKDTFAFGCHAYLIGGGEGNNPKALAAKGVQTVTLDPGNVSAATVADLNKTGPIPIFYTNAYWQKSLGGSRPSRCLKSGVASQYNECMIDPRSPEFYPNFQRQLAKVKSLGGSYIEIDNMDEYVKQGYTADIVRLIQLAANSGVNVFSKNETSPAILKLPNVVGAIVEAGNKGSAAYRKGFNDVGKKCAGVVMINAGENKSVDPYVSYTTGNHPQYQKGNCKGLEYTKFCGCTPNSAGPRVAGTPVAVGDVPIPPPTNAQPPLTPFTNPFGGSTPFSGLGGGGSPGGGGALAASPGQFTPQAFRGCADNPNCTNSTLAKNEIKPITDDAAKKKATAQEKDATKKEIDELFGDAETDSEDGEDVKKEEVTEPGQRGTLTCIPRAASRGESVTVAWRCPQGTKAQVRSSDARSAFETAGARFGTRRARMVSSTQFSLVCGDAAAVMCTVTLVTRASQEGAVTPPPATITPFMPLKGEESAAPKSCFLGFCL
jgi:hypothetical protein